MKKYKTNLSRGCFHHWSASKAVMELVQNYLDSDGEGEYTFTDTGMTLTNRDIKVSNKLLMMGMSDKRGDNSKRGQFGVGSIQSMVVLIDLGITVTIKNNDIRWTPAFEHCPQFQEDIMVFTEDTCDNGTDFTVELEGLCPLDIEEVKQRCLLFQDREVLYSTGFGDIISNSSGEGEVFCGDLFICQNSTFKYSYNFKPKVLSLGQDRDAVSQWELQALTSKLIVATKDNTFIKEAIRTKSVDTQSVNSQWSDDPKTDAELNDDLAEEFLGINGAKYVTSSYSDHETQKKLGNKSIYLQNDKEVRAIKSSTLYKQAMDTVVLTKAQSFTDLLTDTLDSMEELLLDNDLLPEGSLYNSIGILRDRIANEDYN